MTVVACRVVGRGMTRSSRRSLRPGIHPRPPSRREGPPAPGGPEIGGEGTAEAV